MKGDKFILTPFYECVNALTSLTKLQTQCVLNTDKTCKGKQNISFNLDESSEAMLLNFKKNQCNKFEMRIVVRFCKIKEEKLPIDDLSMEDNFPNHLKIELNGQSVNLPEFLPFDQFRADGRRYPRPVDLTDAILEHEPVQTGIVRWKQNSSGERFYFGVYLVRMRSYEELISSLIKNNMSYNNKMMAIQTQLNGAIKHADKSTGKSRNIKTSLVCPVSLSRMSTPVRGLDCSHVQCFDGIIYLFLNFNKPTWTCPICDKKALFYHLETDGTILDIINDTRSSSANEIIINKDGQWKIDESHAEFYTTSSVNKGQHIAQKNETFISSKHLEEILPSSDWLALKKQFCVLKTKNNLFPFIDETELKAVRTASHVNSSLDTEAQNSHQIDNPIHILQPKVEPQSIESSPFNVTSNFADSSSSVENNKVEITSESDTFFSVSNIKNCSASKIREQNRSPSISNLSDIGKMVNNVQFDIEKSNNELNGDKLLSSIRVSENDKFTISNKKIETNRTIQDFLMKRRKLPIKNVKYVKRNANPCSQPIGRPRTCNGFHQPTENMNKVSQKRSDTEPSEINGKCNEEEIFHKQKDFSLIITKKNRQSRPGSKPIGRPRKDRMAPPPTETLSEFTKERIKAKYLELKKAYKEKHLKCELSLKNPIELDTDRITRNQSNTNSRKCLLKNIGKQRQSRPGSQPLGRPRKDKMAPPPTETLSELTKEKIKAKYLEKFSKSISVEEKEKADEPSELTATEKKMKKLLKIIYPNFQFEKSRNDYLKGIASEMKEMLPKLTKLYGENHLRDDERIIQEMLEPSLSRERAMVLITYLLQRVYRHAQDNTNVFRSSLKQAAILVDKYAGCWLDRDNGWQGLSGHNEANLNTANENPDKAFSEKCSNLGKRKPSTKSILEYQLKMKLQKSSTTEDESRSSAQSRNTPQEIKIFNAYSLSEVNANKLESTDLDRGLE